MGTEILEFHDYNEYLDSKITTLDFLFLQDRGLTRQIVALGYRGTGEILDEPSFLLIRRIQRMRMHGGAIPRNIPFLFCDPSEACAQENLFFQALFDREEDNREGKIVTVLFLHRSNSEQGGALINGISNEDISGYVEWPSRLLLQKEKRTRKIKKAAYADFLTPHPSDLSYTSWGKDGARKSMANNSSANFLYSGQSPSDLTFIVRGTSTQVELNDLERHPNVFRTQVPSSTFQICILYDFQTKAAPIDNKECRCNSHESSTECSVSCRSTKPTTNESRAHRTSRKSPKRV